MSVLLAVILGATVFCGCTAGNSGNKIPTFKIKTTYGTMEFPEQFKDNLKHQEVVEGNSTAEVFSMVIGESEIEVCRIIFGNAEAGDLIGYYDAIPVTLLVHPYAGVNSLDEEIKQIYFGMMDSVNVLVDSMRSNSHFRAGDVPNFKNDTVQMKYWKITIPETLEWEETTQGNTYKVTFYGTIGGVRISLYTICLGDAEEKDIVGIYKADGEQKSLSVKITGMDQIGKIPEADRSLAYAMMDTVNDVLTEIRQSKNFMEQQDSAE